MRSSRNFNNIAWKITWKLLHSFTTHSMVCGGLAGLEKQILCEDDRKKSVVAVSYCLRVVLVAVKVPW
jgi:hypothetical protein